MKDVEKIVAIKEYLARESLRIGNDLVSFKYDFLENPLSTVTKSTISNLEIYHKAFMKFAKDVSDILDC